MIEYQCNICGSRNCCEPSSLGRERPDCQDCGSSVRMRSVIGLLSQGLFGQLLQIDEFPTSPHLQGIGLSDWDTYANRLGRRIRYQNTFYHQEPLLDITRVADSKVESCDFILSADVFEHVAPPVSDAFAGTWRLLKPGGLLILTVPYVVEVDTTTEHFPDLYDWSLAQGADGTHRLYNRTRDGTQEEFDQLVFHGGPGTTLEMRVFSKHSLLAELEAAGFSNIRIADEPMPEIGVMWQHPWSLPVVAWK